MKVKKIITNKSKGKKKIKVKFAELKVFYKKKCLLLSHFQRL